MGHGDEWQMGIVHHANNFGGANGSVGNAGYQDRWLHGLGLVLLSYAKIQLRNESEREMGKRILLPADFCRTRRPFDAHATIKISQQSIP